MRIASRAASSERSTSTTRSSVPSTAQMLSTGAGGGETAGARTHEARYAQPAADDTPPAAERPSATPASEATSGVGGSMHEPRTVATAFAKPIAPTGSGGMGFDASSVKEWRAP